MAHGRSLEKKIGEGERIVLDWDDQSKGVESRSKMGREEAR